MGAHGCIDTATGPRLFAHDFMQRLPHAVEALELESLPVFPRQVKHRRHGMGVVGGELGIDQVTHAKQPAGAGKIADIGGGLAGEYRESRQAVHLRALDLGVPVGSLHQPDHDAATVS